MNIFDLYCDRDRNRDRDHDRDRDHNRGRDRDRDSLVYGRTQCTACKMC